MLKRTHSYLSLTDLPNQSMDAPTRGRCRRRKDSIAPPVGGDFRACLEASMSLSLAPIMDPYNFQQKRARPAPPPLVASASFTTVSHPVYSSAPRVSSPLSPALHATSSSSPFSRPRKGKGEPDLRRIAITTCMQSWIALSIANATHELERIVTEGMEL
ncbi:hypothetical protein F5146DRAFT_1130554 [Armillaria mellea]|nr:hypothetical protein F5146DRAFT_1130554 [Armillaria mellea]